MIAIVERVVIFWLKCRVFLKNIHNSLFHRIKVEKILLHLTAILTWCYLSIYRGKKRRLFGLYWKIITAKISPLNWTASIQ